MHGELNWVPAMKEGVLESLRVGVQHQPLNGSTTFPSGIERLEGSPHACIVLCCALRGVRHPSTHAAMTMCISPPTHNDWMLIGIVPHRHGLLAKFSVYRLESLGLSQKEGIEPDR